MRGFVVCGETAWWRDMGDCVNYGETQDGRSVAGGLLRGGYAEKSMMAEVWHSGTSPGKSRIKLATEAGGRFLSRQRLRPAPHGRPRKRAGGFFSICVTVLRRMDAPGSGRAVSFPSASPSCAAWTPTEAGGRFLFRLRHRPAPPCRHVTFCDIHLSFFHARKARNMTKRREDRKTLVNIGFRPCLRGLRMVGVEGFEPTTQ